MPESELEDLIRAAKESAKEIGKSGAFVAITPEDYQKDPVMLIQLALAILMDRPIFLLVDSSFAPSSKLLKVCDNWEFFDRGDEQSIRAATKRMFEKLVERG